MTSEEIKQLDESSFMPTYGRFDAVLVSGKTRPVWTAREKNTSTLAAVSA